MHSCKEGKDLSSCHQTCKLLAFPFLALCILHLFRCSFYLPLLPCNVRLRFRQRTCRSHVHPFLMDLQLHQATSACDFLHLLQLVTQCFSQSISPSVLFPQPQGVAPGIEDLEDVPGAIIQTGHAKLPLVCHC